MMVIVVIDAVEGITEQDAKIAGIAYERGKGVIIAVNKWDAVEKDDKTIYKYTNKVREVWRTCRMRKSCLSPHRPDSVFRNCSRRSIWYWKTRPCVSRPVCSTRS